MLWTAKVRILLAVLVYLGFSASMFFVLLWIGDEGSRGNAWSSAVLIAAVVAYSYVVVSTNASQTGPMRLPRYESRVARLARLFPGVVRVMTAAKETEMLRAVASDPREQ